MTDKDLELFYLQFFYNSVDLGENEIDIKEFINNQFRASGLGVPKQYEL